MNTDFCVFTKILTSCLRGYTSVAAESGSLAEKGKQKARRVIRLWHAVREASCAWARSFIQTSTYEQFLARLLQPGSSSSSRMATAKEELIRRQNTESSDLPVTGSLVSNVS